MAVERLGVRGSGRCGLAGFIAGSALPRSR
jgi:hypothetical protein